MNTNDVLQVLEDTAYTRTGGSPEELRCAEYLQSRCAALGIAAKLESFPVDMATMEEAEFLADGVSIPCKGYLCAGSGSVEAPFYYLRNTDEWSLSQCRGKIVMIDGYLGYWVYHDLLENGAVGFVTYDGNANYNDCDIDQRELRSYVSKGQLLPGVNINAKDAINLVKNGVNTARITLKQTQYEGKSQNVVADLPGENDEYIVLTAHYDSTSLSQGAYDNMSGSLGLLGIAEYFAKRNHRYGLRFVWCGSEERGLLGAKAYVAAHEAEREKLVLNINLDMIGCIMGKFVGHVCAEEKLLHYLTYFALERGFGIQVRHDVHSSDSTPFADAGIPALSFARYAPGNTATIHNRYDTAAVMSPEQLLADIEFLIAITDRMANAARLPVSREIPDSIKEKLDVYLARKRGPKQ